MNSVKLETKYTHVMNEVLNIKHIRNHISLHVTFKLRQSMAKIRFNDRRGTTRASLIRYGKAICSLQTEEMKFFGYKRLNNVILMALFRQQASDLHSKRSTPTIYFFVYQGLLN